jgi:hypothetical protein
MAKVKPFEALSKDKTYCIQGKGGHNVADTLTSMCFTFAMRLYVLVHDPYVAYDD